MPYYFFTINFKTENGIRGLRKSSKTPKAPLTNSHHSQRDLSHVYTLWVQQCIILFIRETKQNKTVLLQASTVKTFNKTDVVTGAQRCARGNGLPPSPV